MTYCEVDDRMVRASDKPTCQKKIKKVVLVGGALLVLYVILNSWDFNLDFIPWKGDRIIIHKNVCIVEKLGGKAVEVENGVFASEKEIVVYNAVKAETVLMRVSASRSVTVKTWPIRFETAAVPEQFSMQDYPAYFIIASHPGNLYHWWHDSTLGLYGVMKQTKRLNSTVPNQVLHRSPLTGSDTAKNRTRYADIVKAFSVRNDQNVYHSVPSGTCYPFGVFGYKEGNEKEVANFVIKQLDRKYSTECPSGVTVTLIKRKFRKILNIDDLQKALLEAGLANTRIVNMEKMTFKEQWRRIRCTHVLVGVQGAGLQWAIFLRPHSAMLELTHKGWDFFFSFIYSKFNGLKTGRLRATKTYNDWDYISNVYFKGQPMTKSQKIEVSSTKYSKKYPALWGATGFKWANSVYDPKAFRKEIFLLLKATGYSVPP